MAALILGKLGSCLRRGALSVEGVALLGLFSQVVSPPTFQAGGGGRAREAGLLGLVLFLFYGVGALLESPEPRAHFLVMALRILLSIPAATSTRWELTRPVDDKRSLHVETLTRAVSTSSSGLSLSL